jgi:hypothetical protein
MLPVRSTVGRGPLTAAIGVRIPCGQPNSLFRYRLTVGRRALNPRAVVRPHLPEPCEVRTVASTRECHSRHTGSSPVLRSIFEGDVMTVHLNADLREVCKRLAKQFDAGVAQLVERSPGMSVLSYTRKEHDNDRIGFSRRRCHYGAAN